MDGKLNAFKFYYRAPSWENVPADTPSRQPDLCAKFRKTQITPQKLLSLSGSSSATGVWPSAINSISLVDNLGSCGQVNAPADERLTAGDTGILDTSVPHLLVAAALVGETAQIFLRP
jgi:hypothetical protein